MKPERDNQIYIEVRLCGKVYRMTVGIPDAPGHISATDHRDEWIRPKVIGALRNIFGKITERIEA